MSFVFVGNRRFVLSRMIEVGVIPDTVFVVEGTHLHRDLVAGFLPPQLSSVVVASKAELMSGLRETRFDTLISNGCPYILPISALPSARYANIHPSLLPDLRGRDPVIGSVLFARDSGATCHVMDDGIDTGPIIAQVRIPYSPDLDVTTLYQLSFMAERDVFDEALARDFEPIHAQPRADDILEYARTSQDQRLDFLEEDDVMVRKIRAFNNGASGCRFIAEGREFKVLGVEWPTNPYLVRKLAALEEGLVHLSYEGSIIFRRRDRIWRFTGVVALDGGPISVGLRLFAPGA